MDLITAKHGLSDHSFTVSREVDLSLLAPELLKELQRLEQEFNVSTDKLKEISKRFEKELQDGQRRY